MAAAALALVAFLGACGSSDEVGSPGAPSSNGTPQADDTARADGGGAASSVADGEAPQSGADAAIMPDASSPPVQPGPGSVACGATACSVAAGGFCCQQSVGPDACSTSYAACSASGGRAFRCDEPGDCPKAGDRCLLEGYAVAGTQPVALATYCGTNRFNELELCLSDADCPAGTCKTLTCTWTEYSKSTLRACKPTAQCQ